MKRITRADLMIKALQELRRQKYDVYDLVWAGGKGKGEGFQFTASKGFKDILYGLIVVSADGKSIISIQELDKNKDDILELKMKEKSGGLA